MIHRMQMEKRIAAYLAGDLRKEEAEALLAHAQACPECAARFREEQETERILVGARPEAACMPDRRSEAVFAAALRAAAPWPRKRARAWQSAMAAAALAVVAAWAGWNLPNRASAPVKSTEVHPQPRQYALNQEKQDGSKSATAGTLPKAHSVPKVIGPAKRGHKARAVPRRHRTDKKARPSLESIIVAAAPAMESLPPPALEADPPHLFVSVSGGETDLSVSVTRADDRTPGTASAVAFVPDSEGAAWKVCAVQGPPSESSTRYAYIKAPFPGEELAILTTVITDSSTQQKGQYP